MMVSIIIPVYNVEEYLQQCVDSVLNQSYKNLEIILVNDGSIDNSGNICDKYSTIDNRIKVIHKENGGLSDARNEGLEVAKGDYLFYLDSDDYLDAFCIEHLVNSAEKNNAEIVQANFYYDYPQFLLYDNRLQGKDVSFSRSEAMLELLGQKNIKNFAWGKLIRASLAKKYPFEKAKYYEDTFWKYHIIDACAKYVAIAKPLVYYSQRSSSISGAFSIKNLDQLEGESLRLEYIKANYTTVYVEKALKTFNDKILLHKILLKNLKGTEKKKYQDRLQYYQEHYQLRENFKTQYFIFDSFLLLKCYHFYQSIKNRLLTNHWVKIDKDEY